MKIIYLLALLFVLGSCTDSFLEKEDPTKITTSVFWQTEDDLSSAVASVYNEIIRDGLGHYNPRAWFIHAGRTENFSVRNDIQDAYQIGMYLNSTSNGYTANFYKGAYTGIFRANQVIQYGESMSINEDVKNTLIAEARFLRGLNYFFLVSDFGAVPITTAVAETSDDYYIGKSSEEQVWNQVIEDLKAAEKYLPDQWDSENKGRCTRGAALAYLGRAYLYQGDYDSTIVVLKEIVDNENNFGYGLQANYAELFDGQHENGPEGVFELQFSREGGANIWLSASDDPSTLTRSTFAGEWHAPGEVGGWFEMKPTKVLLDSFLEEPTSDGEYDPRALATLAWDYPGCIFYQREFSSTWGHEEIWLRKNQNWWDADEGDWKSELDEYGMRYADVLLMLAEAYTMKGQVTMAVPLVHRIRARAKLTDKQNEMMAYSQEQMMSEIRHQRNLEFAREGLHFYDLRRWGLLEQTIKESKQAGYQNYTSKNEYYPIPEDELNNNPNMTQNNPW
ncbi:RagB/SusD family nutrient uptake outer membrane protein [Sunxiuqinia indica]|uniref:RagB/SusD family nutrient uptake outer membrane protein n=1 Tax=Sunxiuqinia indica TaxID=2692584 RepID=UPI0013580C6F|nr:RagB/SusD family nutrient uptake outer membrane protein [Sunxiuqinia indica]